jgi:hypothetical protein
MDRSLKLRLSPTLLSTALIAFSVLWFISAYVFDITNNGPVRTSKDGASGAPLWALFILILTPLSTLFLVPWLFVARRRESYGLKRVDYFALFAAAAPFLYILFLVFKYVIK